MRCGTLTAEYFGTWSKEGSLAVASESCAFPNLGFTFKVS